jgi:hypothetical protein
MPKSVKESATKRKAASEKSKRKSNENGKDKSKQTSMAAASGKPKLTGMWKILELKKAQIKAREAAINNGEKLQSDSSFHSNERDQKFVKFSGPRRRAA